MRTIKIMYNKDQKQAYIDYESVNTLALTTYFKRISDRERERGKDLLDMSADELKEVISSLDIRREDSRRHLLSLLRGYASWGILTGAVTHSDIFKITAESIPSREAVKHKMIRDPEHLKTILESELDFVNYENRSKRDALIFWLLYSGIPVDDLYALKKGSIDVEKKLVTLDNGDSYEVTDDIIKLWSHCINITFLERKNSRSKNPHEYWQSGLVDNDFLFRPVDRIILEKEVNEERLGDNELPQKKESKKRRYLESAVKRIIDSYADKVSKKLSIPPRNIRLSGLFYKLLCLERTGEKITPEIMAKHMSISYDNPKELAVSIRKWCVDYDDWKLAFGHMNELNNIK